jgi:hypothetical protein
MSDFTSARARPRAFLNERQQAPKPQVAGTISLPPARESLNLSGLSHVARSPMLRGLTPFDPI